MLAVSGPLRGPFRYAPVPQATQHLVDRVVGGTVPVEDLVKDLDWGVVAQQVRNTGLSSHHHVQYHHQHKTDGKAYGAQVGVTAC